jgi:hypothetical protein
MKMQTKIRAYFDSVDDADRAVSRLHSRIPYMRAEISEDENAHAPFSASVYYPWRINMSADTPGLGPQEMGSRVLYTADRMGLPFDHKGKTEVLLTLDASESERARAMLLNLGGSRIRIL